MAKWRIKVTELFPNEKPEIDQFKSKSELWDYLNTKFINVSKENDYEIAQKIVDFYRWCVSPNTFPLPNDLQTSAAINFIERNSVNDDGFRALFQFLKPNEILDYSHLISYAFKLKDREEVINY